MSYETSAGRQFLNNYFDDEELNHLCFDYFPDVYNDFTVGMRKGQKVQMLLEHCQKQDRWPAMMAALERERPKAYAEKFSPALQVKSAHQPHVPIQRNPRQIFISHAHQDAEFANQLVTDLQLRGWQTWMAPDSIRPGEKWLEAINRGLEESGTFLLLLTPHAVSSRWVRDETNVAIELMHDGELKLAPLLVKSCDIPPLWRVYQQIPFQNDYKTGLQALLTELQPEMMAQLAQQYQQLQTAAAAKDWQKGQALAKQIEALYPDYQDVSQLKLDIAREIKRRQIQEKELASLYWQLQAANDASNWDVVKTLGKQIQAIDKDYRDVARLVDQAFAGAKRQKIEMQLAELYSQLQEAVTAEDWNNVLGIGKQIQRLDRGHKDVTQLLALARRQLRRPLPWNSLMTSIPVWGWGVMAIAIIGFSIWGIGQLVEGDSGGTTPVAEATIGGEETDELIQTRTPQPDPVPTKTEPPSPAGLMPTSTSSLVSLPSATPTITNTPIPNPNPNLPPQNATLHDTWTRPADGMVMVYVPGGAFMMGSDTDDINASSDEMPQHEVTLTSFWIDRTEVTNAQYTQCVADGACEVSFFAGEPAYNGEEYPVVGVSWEDANNYCRWADAQLPTEAQWEFAARGEGGWIYPWGNEFDGSKANYCDTNCTLSHRDTQQNDGYELAAPVSSYHPSGDSWVDAADMAGNVQEWVSDWYGDYSSSPQTNPEGPYIGSLKVLRGGGWGSFQSGLRGANRHNELLTWRWISVGFRCAVVPIR